jgi:hypothetical protein
VSNAFSKSTKAQNNFFCLLFKISKNENKNDLQSFLEKENLPGLKTISEKIEENLNIYLKLFVLLYAVKRTKIKKLIHVFNP